MITYKTPEEIDEMRHSGRIAALILKHLCDLAKPGVTTNQLNEFAEKAIIQHKVKPGFKGHDGFPAVVCTSLNEVIVHGVPNNTPLKEGDVLGIDFGVVYKGWYSDVAVTIGIGEISHEANRLINVTRKALRLGIKKAKPGSTTGDIGNTIQRYVESEGYSVVRELVGHGIGKGLHEDPSVPNYGFRHEGDTLKAGMVIAIEPMVIAGPATLTLHRDKFGYASKQKFLTAHFEHTVAITERGPQVLTTV